MQPIIFDLILVVLVLVFAFLGARKGLILSLCSLVAVVVATVGGSLAADALAAPLSAQLAPMVETFIQDNLDAILAGEAGEHAGFLWNMVQGALGSTGAAAAAEDFVAQFSIQVATRILRPVLFLLGFVLVLIVWYFISHALDLVARLPILHTLNTAGGFLFGAVQGAVILVIVFLLLRLFCPDLIPPALLADSRIVAYLQKTPALIPFFNYS